MKKRSWQHGVRLCIRFFLLCILPCCQGNVSGAFYLLVVSAQGVTGPIRLSNGFETISITGDGDFNFPTLLESGQTYTLTLESKPASLDCQLSPQGGAISTKDIDIDLVCQPN